MNNKAILVSFIALFAIVLTLNAVSAFATVNDVVVNDISLKADGYTAAGFASDTVPVEVKFTADETVSDVRVKVYIEGYKSEISESTSRFRVVNGSTYIKRFSIELPESMDLDEDPEELNLLVRISAKGQESVESEYDLTISMQRQDYELRLLSIEAPESASAGSVIALDIVLRNDGANRLDDTYVKVSIPGLVERKVYFGDIADEQDETYDNIRDTLSKRIYLSIPNNAISGIYNIEVEAYNYDASVIEKKQIVISGIGPTEDGDDVEVIDDEDSEETNSTVLILTVVLAIIFVVLLIVLIVLLTKKPAETEEFGEETSYY